MEVSGRKQSLLMKLLHIAARKISHYMEVGDKKTAQRCLSSNVGVQLKRYDFSLRLSFWRMDLYVHGTIDLTVYSLLTQWPRFHVCLF